jgi:DNA-binding transcriptional regulator PaaX
VRKGFIRLVIRGGVRSYVLTVKGQKKLVKFLLTLGTRIRQNRWDGLWRMVLFDIPEKHRIYRDRIREMLRAYGSHQLQKNVWVYPYADIRNALQYLHLIYGKGNADIVLVETKRFLGDEQLMAFFCLSKRM